MEKFLQPLLQVLMMLASIANQNKSKQILKLLFTSPLLIWAMQKYGKNVHMKWCIWLELIEIILIKPYLIINSLISDTRVSQN